MLRVVEDWRVFSGRNYGFRVAAGCSTTGGVILVMLSVGSKRVSMVLISSTSAFLPSSISSAPSEKCRRIEIFVSLLRILTYSNNMRSSIVRDRF
jgi:hypothetical protein